MWTKPDDLTLAPGAPLAVGSKHPGGFNTLLGDGSVRFLRNTVEPQQIEALAKRNDGKGQGVVP